MLKKRHLLVAVILTAAVVWALAFVYYAGFGGYNSADSLVRAREIIVNNYVNPLTDEQVTKLNDAAIGAMVQSLGDQYSNYLNAEGMASYENDKKESYKGIGISVNFNAATGEMTVISPYDDSPAQKAGIHPGDVIEKVGAISVTAETYDSVLSYIKAGKDDTFPLVIRRGEETLTVSVTREEVKRQSVTHKMFAGRIGYIRVSEFIHNTKEEFANALTDLKSREMKGLVIDLRNNPGGYADTVIAMTDSLLPKGIIAYLEDSRGNRQYFNSDETELGLPMAVLINQGTASASELLAGSLQAHDLAVIIGEKSYGKAVGQSVYPLSSKTALYLTNARYFTPKGNCIDGVGIEPDIKVSLAEELMGKISVLEPEEDAQLAKALEVMAQKIPQ